jgi:hypothetical protein
MINKKDGEVRLIFRKSASDISISEKNVNQETVT